MFGLFFLTRIVLDVFGYEYFGQTTQFCSYTFDEKIQIVILKNIIISLLALQIGVLLGPKYVRNVALSSNIYLSKIGLVLFYIGLPFLVYQFIMVGMEVVEIGYSARLNGGVAYRNSFVTSIMSRASFCGFLLYLSNVPKTKYIWRHLTVFVLCMSLQLLEGARYYTFSLYLVLFIYIFYTNRIRFKFWMPIVLIFTLIMLGATVGCLRSSRQTINSDEFYEFFYEQGIGLQILGHSVEYANEINYGAAEFFAHQRIKCDCIMSRFDQRTLPTSKLEKLEKYGNLEFQLTNSINPNALRGGWDMATSYVAEAYILGREYSVFIFSLLVGFVCQICGQKRYWQGTTLIALLLILPYWIFIPRDHIFDFISDNVTNILVLFSIFSMVILEKRFEILLFLRRSISNIMKIS